MEQILMVENGTELFKYWLGVIYCEMPGKIISWTCALTIILMIGMSVSVRVVDNKYIHKFGRDFLRIIFVVYIILVLFVTLGSREKSSEKEYCLIPLYSYYAYLHGATEKLRESMMNILLFYPLGLLGGAVFGKKSILMGTCLSMGIEAFQYIFHLGYAEVDDVIHNTIGMAIGVIVVSCFRMLISNSQKRNL